MATAPERRTIKARFYTSTGQIEADVRVDSLSVIDSDPPGAPGSWNPPLIAKGRINLGFAGWNDSDTEEARMLSWVCTFQAQLDRGQLDEQFNFGRIHFGEVKASGEG